MESLLSSLAKNNPQKNKKIQKKETLDNPEKFFGRENIINAFGSGIFK